MTCNIPDYGWEREMVYFNICKNQLHDVIHIPILFHSMEEGPLECLSLEHELQSPPTPVPVCGKLRKVDICL
jgi:hypothetical protein